METYDTRNLLSLEQLRALPKIVDGHGVYFLWDEQDDLVYVGRSSNLRNRLRPGQHKIKYARTTCLLIGYEHQWACSVLEAKYIEKHGPCGNVMHTVAWNAKRKWA